MRDETADITEELDLGDGDSIVRVVERALVVDPVLRDEQPWQGFIVVASFDESGSTIGIYKYDGGRTLPGAFSMHNPAFDDELVAPLRALTQDDADGPWRTWVTVYNAQTESFHHTYLRPPRRRRTRSTLPCWNRLLAG
ncbi:hypothetical protein [Auritidibacter ignavus]|uniref:hypothetical protein n=1 Tax=Auritidibacter ignavus TaxID=678932 RepID=UPI00109C09A1|nr:hypothetical protein [Auritidibacter ignavus]